MPKNVQTTELITLTIWLTTKSFTRIKSKKTFGKFYRQIQKQVPKDIKRIQCESHQINEREQESGKYNTVKIQYIKMLKTINKSDP